MKRFLLVVAVLVLTEVGLLLSEGGGHPSFATTITKDGGGSVPIGLNGELNPFVSHPAFVLAGGASPVNLTGYSTLKVISPVPLAWVEVNGKRYTIYQGNSLRVYANGRSPVGNEYATVFLWDAAWVRYTLWAGQQYAVVLKQNQRFQGDVEIVPGT